MGIDFISHILWAKASHMTNTDTGREVDSSYGKEVEVTKQGV